MLKIGDRVIDTQFPQEGAGYILKIDNFGGAMVALIKLDRVDGEFWVSLSALQKIT